MTKVPKMVHQDADGQDSEHFDEENCGPSMDVSISPFSLLMFCSAQCFLQNKGGDVICFWHSFFYLGMDRTCSGFTRHLPCLFCRVTLSDIPHYTSFVLTLLILLLAQNTTLEQIYHKSPFTCLQLYTTPIFSCV